MLYNINSAMPMPFPLLLADQLGLLMNLVILATDTTGSKALDKLCFMKLTMSKSIL